MSVEKRKPTKAEIEATVTRIRHRGYTNALFDDVAAAFKRENPDMETVWEYSPPDSKDQSEIRRRETFGYRIVTEDEIPKTCVVPHTQEGGPVRVSDAVLMCAPREVHEAYYAEDHKVALEDAMLPEREYLESIKQKGTTRLGQGLAYGKISTGSQILSIDIAKSGEETQ